MSYNPDMNYFLIFAVIGSLFGLFYTIWGDVMFDKYNVDVGLDEKKIKNLKLMPLSLAIERFWHRFTGVFLGWMFMWVLLDQRVDLFSGNPNFNNLGLPDLVLFILGYIGINGRLPTIAHSVQDWLGKRSGG